MMNEKIFTNETMSDCELGKIFGGNMANFTPIPRDRKIKFGEDDVKIKKEYDKSPEELFKEVPPLNVVPIIPIPRDQVKI